MLQGAMRQCCYAASRILRPCEKEKAAQWTAFVNVELSRIIPSGGVL